MIRDICKCVDEYEQKFFGRGGRKASFYMTDLTGIVEKSGGALNTYSLVFNALEAGFMVGYKCAKREDKKSVKRC